jgi:hypothetical protein
VTFKRWQLLLFFGCHAMMASWLWHGQASLWHTLISALIVLAFKA